MLWYKLELVGSGIPLCPDHHLVSTDVHLCHAIFLIRGNKHGREEVFGIVLKHLPFPSILFGRKKKNKMFIIIYKVIKNVCAQLLISFSMVRWDYPYLIQVEFCNVNSCSICGCGSYIHEYENFNFFHRSFIIATIFSQHLLLKFFITV